MTQVQAVFAAPALPTDDEKRASPCQLSTVLGRPHRDAQQRLAHVLSLVVTSPVPDSARRKERYCTLCPTNPQRRLRT
jgi:hypothetical protein